MLSSKLRKLRLGHAASVLEAHHQRAINEKLGYLEFLGRLVDDELQTREHKGLDKRMRTARFPVLKTLEEFDFAFQPSLDVKLIKALADCEFVAKHETILFVGPPGVGKSHLATALGVKACMRGYSVLFTTIQHLASQLSAAIADLSLEKLIGQYVEADLIVLDELGFTPLNKVVADHVFRIVSERYERGAIILTSNKPFDLWGEMFADPILATAVLDRLVHHAHIIPITGESYRTKDRKPPANGRPKAKTDPK
ncbi:MAG: IS21-like element helper ATPase IstB [Acidimicrobiales bacterium]